MGRGRFDPPFSRQSTMSSVEVPYNGNGGGGGDDSYAVPHGGHVDDTGSESSQSTSGIRVVSSTHSSAANNTQRLFRPSLHHEESADTHRHFLAQDPGISLYRHEELQAVLDIANAAETPQARREANQVVMEKLANLGVSVFLISYECDDVWKEVKHCIFEASNMALWNCSPDRCLLYEDEKGRLFNLLAAGDFAGLRASYDAMLDKASGLEAICALVVLLRTFACVELREGTRPAYIALILGLVLTEEISNAWINVSMLVWGMPSISAYALTQPVTVDWPKQALLLMLAIASILELGSQAQHILTLTGIAWACIVLVANVGARAWRHLKLMPLPYRGVGRTLAAFIAATIMGLIIPYIGFRQAQGGGQIALETVIIGSIVVAIVFILSDFDIVQEFVVNGSEQCNQDPVNFGVGIWWFLTVILSMYFCKRLPVPAFQLAKENSKRELDKSRGVTRIIQYIPEPEPLVEEEQASPVGYRVKQIPDFKLDPNGSAKAHLPPTFLACEVIFGVVLAAAIAGLIIYSAFTDKDDKITSSSSSSDSSMSVQVSGEQ